jgi:uncharacterized protein (TIGR03435 family)
MKNFLAAILGFVAVIGAWTMLPLGAQATPTFDVASVKPNKSGPGPQRVGFAPGGRFVATNIPAIDLIAVAFGTPQPLPTFRITGGPGWATSDRFDIAAKADGDPQPGPNGPPTEMFLMVRAMLADRFKLVVHTETREMPFYTLGIDRSDGRLGPQLHPAAVDCAALRRGGPRGGAAPAPPPPGQPVPCGMMMAPGRLNGGGATLAMLSTVFSRLVNRVVEDRTGLTGNYDVTLEFTPDQSMLPPGGLPPGMPSPPSDGPSLFTALREQLGLKLDAARGPVEIVVIDHIEPPTPD